MVEYWGTEKEQAIQIRMRQRHLKFNQIPGWINGGRGVAFDEPDRVGWDVVQQVFELDRMVAFPLADKRESTAKIKQYLGEDIRIAAYDVYLGSPQSVLEKCKACLAASTVPDDWQLTCTASPSDAQIDEIQHLNAAIGISPYPAFYSRGEAVPILHACLHDNNGTLIACASATMRYHKKSRLSGFLFAGMLSVANAHRRMGYGLMTNAALLVKSHEAFAWRAVHQQTVDSAPSQLAIMAKCGLQEETGLVSLTASDDSFTISL